mmetsp:Transcript_99073/g.284837  ORF Transcript_99073/g.284837 Transcript_99073/m.284837 type:complete len:214 (+) Transcript_99073:547-1188(+)
MTGATTVHEYASPCTRDAYEGLLSMASYQAAKPGQRPASRSLTPAAVKGIWTPYRSSIGTAMQSAAESSAPSKKGPPARKRPSKSSIACTKVTRLASISASVRLPTLYEMPMLAFMKRSISNFASAICPGSRNSMGPTSGKASSKRRKMASLSHTTSPEPANLMAGTMVVGTMSLYHCGLSYKLMRTSSNGMPFSRRPSQTRSQKGHQPFVSR